MVNSGRIWLILNVLGTRLAQISLHSFLFFVYLLSIFLLIWNGPVASLFPRNGWFRGIIFWNGTLVLLRGRFYLLRIGNSFVVCLSRCRFFGAVIVLTKTSMPLGRAHGWLSLALRWFNGAGWLGYVRLCLAHRKLLLLESDNVSMRRSKLLFSLSRLIAGVKTFDVPSGII